MSKADKADTSGLYDKTVFVAIKRSNKFYLQLVELVGLAREKNVNVLTNNLFVQKLVYDLFWPMFCYDDSIIVY